MSDRARARTKAEVRSVRSRFPFTESVGGAGDDDGGKEFSITQKPEKCFKILSQPLLFDNSLDPAIPWFGNIISGFHHRVFLAVGGDGDMLLGHFLLDEKAAYGSSPLL